MTVLASQSAGARFDFGRVFGRVIALIRAHGLVLAVGSIVIVGLPHAGGTWLIALAFGKWFVAGHSQIAVWRLTLSIVFAFAVSIFDSLAAAWVALIVIAQSKGDDPIRPARMLRAIAALAPLIVANSVLYFLAVTFGSVLLVIPGLFIATAWAVSLPALVNEGLDPITALGRSRDLTRRYPWPVIGCILLVYVSANLVIYAVIMLAHGLTASMPTMPYWLTYAVSPVLRSFEQLILAGVVASLYVELVTLKEGGFHSTVADAFD